MRLVVLASLALASCAVAACSLLVDTSGLGGAGTSDDGGGEETGIGAAETGAADASEAAAAADADATVDGGDDAAIPVLARDTFSRTTANGWGQAEIGGLWSLAGAASQFAVTGGAGAITIASEGTGGNAQLGAVSTDDAEVDVVLRADKLGSGSGLYLSIHGRRVGSNEYTCTLIVKANGTFSSSIDRQQASSVILASVPTSSTISPGEAIRVRFQATGTQPTHLRMKVWKMTEAQPADWTLQVIDSAAELQAKGTVGLDAYLSSTATNAPVRVSFDDVLVQPASLVP